MMNFIRQYQTVIAFIAVVIVVYGGYQFFFATPSEPVVQVSQAPGSGVDQDLVALLFELRGIRLETTIFSDSVFMSLQDFGKELVSEPIGRNNPFAPLGGSAPLPVKPK